MREPQIDAWLFMAVAYGREKAAPASLSNLIGAADWINHAIPMAYELRGGLNRLIAAGLIEYHDEAFALTMTGEATLANAHGHGGLWMEFDRLEREFEALEYPSVPSWRPSPAVIEAAVLRYQQEADAILESISPDLTRLFETTRDRPTRDG